MQPPPRHYRSYQNSYQPRQPRVQQRQHHYRHHTSAGTPTADWLTTLLSNELFLQVAPLIVLFVVPLLFLATNKYKRTLFWPLFVLASTVSMVLESLSGALPWNWFSGSTRSGAQGRERKGKGKKAVRTRAEQLAVKQEKDGQGQQTHGDEESDEEDGTDGYYPGIVNISGTYCFMDATLQAFASLNYLQPYIDAIHARAEAFDVPTPVVDALRDILHQLNKPQSSRRALRPVALIQALSAPPPGHRAGPTARGDRLFSSREHQDAQELFQVIVEAVKSEAAEVGREAGARDLGLGGALASTSQLRRAKQDSFAESEITKSVFDGLTANKRTCITCGYTEAVMHFAFDSWQLALPARGGACQLQDCLADYTRLELLTDCMCRRCSLMATHEKYAKDGEAPATPLSASPSSTASSILEKASLPDHDEKVGLSKSKKKRLQETRKLANRIKTLLDEGRVEEDIKGVQLVKVLRPSTKQAMVARPPPVLVLHLNRSMHFGGYYGATKNNCQVIFPEILDLSPFTTSGTLSTKADAPISRPGASNSLQRESVATLYRLSAVVCHYGQHSFGHYVSFRRRPRSPKLDEQRRWAPPSWRPGQENGDLESKRGTGRGWLRISDDDVRECGIESVLQEGVGAFMLFYERIVVDGSSPSTAPAAVEARGHSTVSTRAQPAPLPNGVASGMRPLAMRTMVGGGIPKYPYANGLDSDDDATPRCSEETLKPSSHPASKLKTAADAPPNGSAESLASTLLSVSAQSKSEAPSLSSSPSAKGIVGPARIIRSVSLARTLPEKTAKAEVNGHAADVAAQTPVAAPAPLSA